MIYTQRKRRKARAKMGDTGAAKNETASVRDSPRRAAARRAYAGTRTVQNLAGSRT